MKPETCWHASRNCSVICQRRDRKTARSIGPMLAASMRSIAGSRKSRRFWGRGIYNLQPAAEHPPMNETHQTDSVTISIPGREDDDHDVAWFAFNRKTRENIRFSSSADAERFVQHPDNRKE